MKGLVFKVTPSGLLVCACGFVATVVESGERFRV